MPGIYMKPNAMEFVSYKATLSVQKRKYDPRWAYPGDFHWHDYYEMEFICTGSGTHYFSGRQTDFSAGYAFLVTPSDFHRFVSNGEPMHYYNLNFNKHAIPEEIRTFLSTHNAPAEATLTGEEMSIVTRELDNIVRETGSTNPFSSALKLGCLGKVLIIFCRALIRRSEALPDSFCEYNSAVRRAMDIIQRDFKKNIGLSTVAAEIGYSPNYLGSLFVRETGISFTEYLQNKRISHAENLLRNTDLSIKEISEVSGFSSPSYFISTFKKKRGCTPVSIRKKNI